MSSRTSISRELPRALLTLAAVSVAALPLAGCSATPASSAGQKPATVTQIGDDGTKQVTLTERAAQRLDLKTAKVSGATISGKVHKVVPFAAVFYDAQGQTWVYTNPEPLVFVRQKIVVEGIVADLAIITDGPPLDTLVVTVGVAELYGAEVGVGK